VYLERLLASPRKVLKYRPYSKFPAVERDFSLLVPEGTPYRLLAEAVQGAGLEEVRSVRPVERLPVGKIAAGQYSLLLRVTFQSERRTLASEEIGEASRRLLAALEPLGVRLRS
jgi:phenylalanyl-tRNA synthetase beta chain